MIYGLLLNYDSLTQHASCEHFCRCETRLPGNKNYDSLTQRTSCKHFICDAKHACLIIKTTTLQLNVHSANILHDMKYDTPSSDRGPLADNQETR